jgi:hypothetical protein
MARLTGKAGAVTVGGTTWIVTSWSYSESVDAADIRAMGDTWTERVALFKDYTVEVEGYLSTTEPYAQLSTAGAGSSVAFTLKTESADTNPVVSDTGLCTEMSLETPHDGPVTVRCTIVSEDGAAGPTVDTSPSS